MWCHLICVHKDITDNCLFTILLSCFYHRNIIFIIFIRICLKVKTYICNPYIPVDSADFTSISPKYWNLLFHRLTSLRRKQRIFCSWSHSHSTEFSLHLVPITAGCTWPEAMWIQSLPKIFTHDQCCRNRNPDPLHDLGSNALSTLQHALQ